MNTNSATRPTTANIKLSRLDSAYNYATNQPVRNTQIGLLSSPILKLQQMSEGQNESFHSFDYPIDEKEFKELQVDLVKRQLIEERYQPKRYCNQEIKPPTPTIDPSKVFITQGQKINQNNYNSKSTVTLLTSRKQRQQSPHNSQSNDLKTDQQPLHLIALRKNRDNLINILTSEEQKELRLKITPEQINKLQKETFNQVKQAYLDDQQQKRQIQYKKVIMSRKSCDQVAFDMRFLPKKQRAKLQQRLRWYVVNNVNMNIEIDKGNKVEYKFDQEIDQYFKDNFGYK